MEPRSSSQQTSRRQHGAADHGCGVERPAQRLLDVLLVTSAAALLWANNREAARCRCPNQRRIS